MVDLAAPVLPVSQPIHIHHSSSAVCTCCCALGSVCCRLVAGSCAPLLLAVPHHAAAAAGWPHPCILPSTVGHLRSCLNITHVARSISERSPGHNFERDGAGGEACCIKRHSRSERGRGSERERRARGGLDVVGRCSSACQSLAIA